MFFAAGVDVHTHDLPRLVDSVCIRTSGARKMDSSKTATNKQMAVWFGVIEISRVVDPYHGPRGIVCVDVCERRTRHVHTPETVGLSPRWRTDTKSQRDRQQTHKLNSPHKDASVQRLPAGPGIENEFKRLAPMSRHRGSTSLAAS